MKRFKVNIDMRLSRINELELTDDMAEVLIRDVADKISDQLMRLGTGRMNYEVVEEEQLS